MNVESDDPVLNKVAVANIVIESLVALASLVIFYKQVSGDDVAESLARKIRQHRVKYFGPPPPSEEQIENMARQVNIEAARILREAQ